MAKAGRRRRRQPFEPAPRFRAARRRRAGWRMNLRADMMRDQTDDAFAVDRRQSLARISQPFGETINPDARPGFSITSDDGNVSRNRAMAGPSAVRSIRRAAWTF